MTNKIVMIIISKEGLSKEIITEGLPMKKSFNSKL